MQRVRKHDSAKNTSFSPDFLIFHSVTMPGAEGGLGSALVGERITMGQLQLQVTKLLGEGNTSRKECRACDGC